MGGETNAEFIGHYGLYQQVSRKNDIGLGCDGLGELEEEAGCLS